MSQVIDSIVAIPALIQLFLRSMYGTVRSRSPWIFLFELLKRPASVGAVWPSSRRLAQRMAAQIPAQGEGLVVELGGGTGVVTQALLDRGIDPSRIVIVERAPGFVRHLRQRFPAVNVVEGDAAHLSELLPKGIGVDSVVSSLPLRSLPAEVGAAIMEQWRQVLREDGELVQFTYDLRGLKEQGVEGFVQKSSPVVWVNLPPARVMVLNHQPIKNQQPTIGASHS